jgi:zinc protease
MKLFAHLLLFVALFAQLNISAEELPTVKYSSLDEVFPLRNDIRTGQFENGLKYFILKNNKPENRVSLRMPVKIGSVDESDIQQGMAHFVEHMCFNGTEDFPKSELINYLEKNGVKFGAHLNAYTSFDETVYMLELPADDDKVLETGVQILENWAHKVTFADKDIDDERGVIIEEARLRGGVQTRMFDYHKEVSFYNSKYKNRLPIGDTTLLRSSGHEEFRNFYKKWYRPDLMAVIIVGDIDVDKMEKYVKKYFGSIPVAKNAPQPEKYSLPENKMPLASIATDKELPFPTVSISYRRPGKEQKGTYGEYKTNIIDQIGIGALNERLAEQSLSADPAYQFSRAGYSRSMGAEDFDLIAVAKGTEYKKAADVLLTETMRATKHGITDSELARMKENIISNYKQMYSEKNNTESSDLGNELVRHFLSNEAVPGIAYEYAFVSKILPTITKEEVNARLATYIDDNNYLATISLPASSDNVPTQEDFAATYKEVTSKNIAAYTEEVNDKPLFDKSVTPGKIVSKKDLPQDVKMIKLSNGASIYFKNTDFKDDEITIRAYSKGGSSLMSDKDFVSGRFADELVNSSGISEFDIVTLMKMMSSKNFNVSPSIGELTEGFRGSSNTEEFEEMLQLLHLYFTNPRIDEESFQSWKTKRIDALINSKRNPQSVLSDSVGYILSGYHPRSKPLTEQDLAKVDMNEAMRVYKARFANAGDFNFIFTGNLDKVNFEELVAKYIGSLNGSNKSENWKDLGAKMPKGNLNKEFKKGIDQNSRVIMAFTTDDFKYNQTNRQLVKSLDKVLGIRLREQLREEKGGVYNVSAYSSFDKFPDEECYIIVTFGCDPNRVDELKADTKMIVEELQRELISDENMTKIKETQRRDFELALKDNGTWSAWIYNSLWYGESLSELDKYLEVVENLSKEDIRKAAKKYLNYNSVKSFVLSPEESN